MSGVALRSAVVLVAGRAGQLLLGLVQVRLLFTSLSLEDAGLFSYVTSLSALLATMADAGATTIAAREASREPEREGSLLGALFSLKLVLSGVAAAAFVALTAATLGRAATPAALALALSVVASALAGADVVFQVRQRFLWPSLLRISSQAFLVGGFAVFAARGRLSLDEALVVYAIATAAAPVATFLLARRTVPFPFFPGGAGALLRLAAPHGVASALVAVYFHAGTILLRNWKGDEATAVYGAAFKLFAFAIFLPGLVMVSVLPLLARASVESPERGHALYERVFRVFAALSIAALAALVNLAKPIVAALYGLDRYAESVPVLIALGGALVFVGFGSVASAALVAYGGQKAWMRIAFFAALANVGANVLLIGPLGPLGAAVATLVTEALVAVLAVLAVRRRERFSPFSPRFPRVLLAGALAFGVSSVLRDAPLGIAIAGVALVTVAYLVRFERAEGGAERGAP